MTNRSSFAVVWILCMSTTERNTVESVRSAGRRLEKSYGIEGERIPEKGYDASKALVVIIKSEVLC